MKRLNLFLILFTFMLFFLTPSLATALLAEEATKIPYQVNNSDRIVIGTVSKIDTYPTYTIYTISVKEWLYNPQPLKTIKVKSNIGSNLWVEDEVVFTKNESALLMLKDENLGKQLFRVFVGIAGKRPVSDRDAVIEELKTQGKWPDENQTWNKTNDGGNGLSNKTDESINMSIDISVIKYTHEDLNNNSDMILIGTVKEILPSKWNTINGKQPNKSLTELIPGVDFIYTDIIISVDKYLKNPLSSREVIVRTSGGIVGNVSMTPDVEARFKPSEKVLLYLSKETSPNTFGSEHFWVTGLSQGKFTITDDGKAVRPDENTTLDELLSTIKQTENKTNNTGMTGNTGTTVKQEENSNNNQKSNATPFMSPIYMIASMIGAIVYAKRKQ